MKCYSRFSWIVLGAALSGCGGGGSGGGDGTPDPAPAPVTQYTVSTSAGDGGAISPTSAVVESGEDTSFSISADNGYEISSVDGCSGTLQGTTYTTDAIGGDCEITAVFNLAGNLDTVAPGASIEFPWAVSRSSASTITVRGVAADTGGKIRSVKVNGIEATLSEASLPSATDIYAVHYSEPDGFFTNGTDDDAGTTAASDTVEWEVEIPIESGEDTALIVETEDDSGNIDSIADTAQVLNKDIPTNFIIDRGNRNLIGITGGDDIVTMGLDDETYQSVELASTEYYCHAIATRGLSDEMICTSIAYRDDVLKVFSLSLHTGEKQLLSEYDLGLDPEIWDSSYPEVARVTDDGTSLYVLLSLLTFSESVESKNLIVRYDFADSQFTVVIDGETDSGKSIQDEGLELVGDGMLVYSNGALSKVDYMGADLQSVAALTGAGSTIEVNAAEDTAYLANVEVITSVSLSDGEPGEEYLDDDEPLFTTNLFDSAGLDEANSRLLVGDKGYDYIYAVDVDTGERTEFASNGVGSGKRLTSAGAIELDEANGVAYILDDGGNSNEILFQVDLNTGDRTVLARLDLGCFNSAQDLVLDTEGQRVFAVFHNVIRSVSLESGAITHIGPGDGSNWCGGSYSFTGAILDAENNRLLVTETQSDSLMAVDLATYAISTVYSDAAIDSPADIEFDKESGILYIASEENGALLSFDEETGESTLLTDSCIDEAGTDSFDPQYSGLKSIYLDPVLPILWVSANGRLIQYDLQNSSCSHMPWLNEAGDALNNEFVVDIELTQSGQILGVQNHVNSRVVQVDFASGDIVTIAR